MLWNSCLALFILFRIKKNKNREDVEKELQMLVYLNGHSVDQAATLENMDR